MCLFLSLHQAYEKGTRYVAISESLHQGFILAHTVDLDRPTGCNILIALSVYTVIFGFNTA